MNSLHDQMSTLASVIEKLHVTHTEQPVNEISPNSTASGTSTTNTSTTNTSTTDSNTSTSKVVDTKTSLVPSDHTFKFQFSPSRFDPNAKPFSQTLYNAARASPVPTSTTPSFGYNPISATGLYHPTGANSNSSGFFGYHRPVEVPTFWHHDPTSWFEVLEGEFEVLSITEDRTKYSSLLKGLGTSTCKSLSSVMKSLPATGKYAKLKEQIIKKYSQTAHQQIDQLFKHCSLGDKKRLAEAQGVDEELAFIISQPDFDLKLRRLEWLDHANEVFHIY
ncbi:hypothetical protein TKK_0017502 [Trichogramma kaykai]|uniref:DUF7041 domain-containing protein n=1 Tax=Trichogramma kaykai TaxID=54128 RepID=A0ABD2W3F4_9HYME